MLRPDSARTRGNAFPMGTSTLPLSSCIMGQDDCTNEEKTTGGMFTEIVLSPPTHSRNPVVTP